MKYLRAIAWWALTAVLLAAGAVVVAVWWPDRAVLVLALGAAGITAAVLSLKEET